MYKDTGGEYTLTLSAEVHTLPLILILGRNWGAACWQTSQKKVDTLLNRHNTVLLVSYRVPMM